MPKAAGRRLVKTVLWAACLCSGLLFGQDQVTIGASASTLIAPWDTSDFITGGQLHVYGELGKALLRFDLSAVPDGARITSAKLTLWIDSPLSDPASLFHFYNVFESLPFDDTTVSYTSASDGHPWSAPGMQLGIDYFTLPGNPAPLEVNQSGFFTVDLTRLCQRIQSTKQTAVNLTFFGLPELNYQADLRARDYPDPDYQPALTVTYSQTMPVARVTADALHRQMGPLTLDARGSSLLDGSQPSLSYAWTSTAVPAGSKYTASYLIGQDSTATFQPDVPGLYSLQLKVTNTATQETDTANFDFTALNLAPHPRLHLNKELLDRLAALRTRKDPKWVTFEDWARTHTDYSDLTGGVTFTYMLAHLVTGEKQFFDWGWNWIAKQIYVNGVDNKAGQNSLSTIYGSAHAAAYQGGAFVAEVAIFYDWAYANLSDIQKSDLVTWMNAANRANNVGNPYRESYFRNDAAAVAYGLAASVYATLDDNPEALEQLGWFHQSWTGILKALDVMGVGGAMAEGTAYGSAPTSYNLIRLCDAVFYAGGEDLFAAHPYFQSRLFFDAFSTYPSTAGGPGAAVRYEWPGVPYVEGALLGGDGARAISSYSLTLRSNGLILARHFPQTEAARTWNWVFRQPALDRPVFSNIYFADLLFADPNPQIVKPSRLSYFDPGMGYVYVRSDWDSPDATWISFNAGPHLDTHQHLDQGGFTIFKRHDLAPKTGDMDNGEMTGSHSLAYFIRTISTNGLLVGDPKETFQYFTAGYGCGASVEGSKVPAPDNSGDLCPPNDGGQRTAFPYTMAPNPDSFDRLRVVYETAKVTGYKDQNGVVTIAADLTNAYNNPQYTPPGNSPKVTRVHRRLVYLRDLDILLVGDTVESTDPSFEKTWLLHALDKIQTPAGKRTQISPGEFLVSGTDEAKIEVDGLTFSDKDQPSYDQRPGYASLLAKVLFPRNFTLTLVGGRDPADTIHEQYYVPNSYNFNDGHFHRHIKDFWVKDYSEGVYPHHRSSNWPPAYPLEAFKSVYQPIYGPGYGRWRLELRPAVAATVDHFLTVMQPSLSPSSTLPAIQQFEDEQAFGAQITAHGRRYTITFDKTQLRLPSVAVE